MSTCAQRLSVALQLRRYEAVACARAAGRLLGLRPCLQALRLSKYGLWLVTPRMSKFGFWLQTLRLSRYKLRLQTLRSSKYGFWLQTLRLSKQWALAANFGMMSTCAQRLCDASQHRGGGTAACARAAGRALGLRPCRFSRPLPVLSGATMAALAALRWAVGK